MEAVTLKKLKKIRIGHNGDRPGSGWFLDKVVVQSSDDRVDDVVFECNRYHSESATRTGVYRMSNFPFPFCPDPTQN